MSRKSKADCLDCGGKPIYPFKWRKGKWLAGVPASPVWRYVSTFDNFLVDELIWIQIDTHSWIWCIIEWRQWYQSTLWQMIQYHLCDWIGCFRYDLLGRVLFEFISWPTTFSWWMQTWIRSGIWRAFIVGSIRLSGRIQFWYISTSRGNYSTSFLDLFACACGSQANLTSTTLGCKAPFDGGNGNEYIGNLPPCPGVDGEALIFPFLSYCVYLSWNIIYQNISTYFIVSSYSEIILHI